MTAPQAPRGTLDWFGARAALRRRVIETGRAVFEPAGYGEVVTPTFEDTAVFQRTSGEGSDVVRKEMYTFEDRGGRSLTLRPESTAPVIRAYLEHGMSHLPQPVKLWYVQSHFRYAAVQKGRYREHYQFGVEAVGSDDAAVDAEVIALQDRWYRRLGMPALELELNSIGDERCRPAYLERLTAFLDAHLDELCEECRERRQTNPLRVFDCKNQGCQAVLAAAPKISDALCEECAAHFAAVRAFLDARGVAYQLAPGLVRGLDYYVRTAWEFVAPGLGSQAGTVGGGGRYDGLAEALGGARTPGVGFGAGLERIVLTLEEHGAASVDGGIEVFFAVAEEAARPRLYALMDAAREQGIRCDTAFGGRRLKRLMEQAARRGARLTVIVGPEEWEQGRATLRDMNTGDQRAVPLERLTEELRG